MSEALASPLSAWESFYVIVGSSGAALTGLMFVVIALIADTPAQREPESIDAFGTPTIVHFCVSLLIAAIISAPWHTLVNVAVAIGATGGGGLGYVAIVIRRAHRQTSYKPVFEDWLWYTALPLIAYGSFLIGGILLPWRSDSALFAIGGATVLLLFVGIHNAWDTVTYIAINMSHHARPNEPAAPAPGTAPPSTAAPSARPH